MKQKTFLKVFSPVFALSIILSGCGSNSHNNEKTATKPKVDFKVSEDNNGEVAAHLLVYITQYYMRIKLMG